MHNESGRSKGLAFTIIEVMIALTMTLLILLAVTKTFRALGKRVTSGQAELKMSSELRDATDRLRKELQHATFSDVSGYLVYHEGNMTDGTLSQTSLARFDSLGNRGENTDYFPTNRYGDLDDYLAFTAQIPGTSSEERPFMGYIPRGVLAAKAYSELYDKLGGVRPTLAQFEQAFMNGGTYNEAASAELVPFFSHEAEIAYWLSPQWSGTYADGQLAYRDANGDLVPDLMRLHRRVLLIRDDLNLSLTRINLLNPGYAEPAGAGSLSTIPFLVVNSSSSTLQVFPMSVSAGFNGSCVNFWTGDSSAATPDWTDAPGNWSTGDTLDSPNWLVGVARAQQVMDLSMARETNEALWAPVAPDLTIPATGISHGMPSRFLKANSLIDLSRPENRFAHVRMPRSVLATGTSFGSTMPLLALGPPLPFMTAAERVFDAANSVGFYDYSGTGTIVRDLVSQADPDGVPGTNTPGAHLTDSQYRDPTVDVLKFYGERFSKFTMTGFLRPEFALADEVSGPPATSPTITRRARNDVVANDVLSFDLKIHDDGVPVFTWLGPDAVEGSAGDDNDNGESSDTSPGNIYDANELGFPGSDDEIMTLDDLNIREALTTPPTGSLVQHQPDLVHGFVDLFAPRLAGHPLGDVSNPAIDRTRLAFLGFLNGADTSENQTMGFGEGTTKSFPAHFLASGNFVINERTAADTQYAQSFFQATYDSRANDLYDPGAARPDRFNQELSNAALFNRASTVQYFSAATGSLQTQAVPVSTRIWTATAQPAVTAAPVLNASGHLDLTGGDVQVTRPVNRPLGGLKIDLRLYDRKAARIRQQSVIWDAP